MKYLYLIRHSKATHDHSFKDFDRTLVPKGADDAQLMGVLLKERKIYPEAVVSSNAMRAYSTAIIICKALGFPANQIGQDESLYESTQEHYLNAIRQTRDDADTLFLFAHNPTITDVANLLANQRVIDNLPTTGVVGLSFDIPSWKNLEATMGTLVFYESPKNHRPS